MYEGYEMDESNPKRVFDGVWIPNVIWLNTELNALDKIVFTEIRSLDDEIKGCWASNKYLAKFCQCSESNITKTVRKLKELGLVFETNFDGRHRVLRVANDYKLKKKEQKDPHKF